MTRRLLPTRALALLLAIGFLDLIVTAVLHAQGMIIELNPRRRQPSRSLTHRSVPKYRCQRDSRSTLTGCLPRPATPPS